MSSPVGARESLPEQNEAQRRREVGRDLISAGWLPSDITVAGESELGGYFLDKYLFLTKPTILRRLAVLMSPMIPAGVDRLAATEDGAGTLAVALSLESGLPFVTIAAFSPDVVVRGELHPSERAVVVEDVVASGSRSLATAQALRSVGAQVSCVLAVVDREQGASRRLAEAGLILSELFTASALLSVAGPESGAGS